MRVSERAAAQMELSFGQLPGRGQLSGCVLPFLPSRVGLAFDSIWEMQHAVEETPTQGPDLVLTGSDVQVSFNISKAEDHSYPAGRNKGAIQNEAGA